MWLKFGNNSLLSYIIHKENGFIVAVVCLLWTSHPAVISAKAVIYIFLTDFNFIADIVVGAEQEGRVGQITRNTRERKHTENMYCCSRTSFLCLLQYFVQFKAILYITVQKP